MAEIDGRVPEEQLLRAWERIADLEYTLRQARACLLNWQPNEINPMQRQLQKMVGEITDALERGQ